MTTARQRRKILIVLILSLMMVVSAVTALNVALPSLARATGASQSQLQWIVDGYALIFAGLLLPAGALGDRFGRRGVLLTGLGLFAGAAFTAIFTTDPTVLIGLRIAMGVGAAFVMPVTLTIISTSFPPDERGKAVGLWAGIASAGAIAGLLTSGLLLEWFSWNSIFVLNVCLGLLAFIGAYVYIPRSKDPHAAPLDFVGAILSLIGVVTIVYALIEAPEKGWFSTETIGMAATSLVAFAGFVWYELRTKHPLLDPRYFKSKSFSAGTLSLTVQFFAAFGFFFMIFQYLQVIAGFSPLTAGLGLLPMALLVVPLSRHTPALAAKYGLRLTSFVGLTSIGLAFLVWMSMGTDFSYWHFLPGLLFFGIGMGMGAPPATTAIISSLPAEKQGVASAVNDTTRELGGALGIATLGSLLNDRYRSGIESGFGDLHIPGHIIEGAQHSIIAVQHAAQGQGPLGEKLLDIAEAAYVDGLATSLFVGATIVLLVAAGIGLFGPASLSRRRSSLKK